MSARDNILARIRAASRRPAEDTGVPAQRVTDYMAAHHAGPLPRCDWEPVAQFCRRARDLASTVAEVDSLDATPHAVSRYLRERDLPNNAACWPELKGLDWNAAGVNVVIKPAEDNDLVGITGAFCGIAETGTLVLLSGAETPASTSLLPETHIAVLHVRRIVRTMEDAWRMLREETNGLPRSINLISGPSRTADIEQTLVLGAHGPYRVHIILIGQPC